jgi:hypothetical protein
LIEDGARFVRQCIEREDVDWFPKNRAMCLKQDLVKSEAQRSEDLLKEFSKRIDSSERNLTTHHEKRIDKVQRSLEHLAKQQKDVR